uniref:MxcI n=1 Tax=Stigmatella aurantiaca TaxID=41 RepID=Q9F633_STIAU|nr:MxcI [Stigmatella aurantiaca Sg a15]
MNLTKTLRPVRWLAAVLALPLLTACGDDEEVTPPPPPSTASQYAVVTQVTSDSGSSASYVVVTDSVDHTETLSLTNAIEVTGRALVFGPPKKDHFFVSSGKSVIRYNLTESGTPEKGATVLFSDLPEDITEYQHQFRFISETKAYFFDGSTTQVIVWNPSAMTVTRRVPFGDVKPANTVLSFSSQPLDVANLVIMPLGWRPSTGTTITKQAGVLVVDPNTDTLQFVKKEFKEGEGCGYVRDGVVGKDGKVYLSTEAYGSASYRVHRDDPATLKPCLLRFDPQTKTFDDFFVDLTTLSNGAPAGSVLQGPGGKTYLRVLDEASFTGTITKETHPRLLASAVAWKWWEIKLDTLTATPVSTLPAAMGSTFLFPANDRVLFTNFTSNSQTELRELTDASGKVATVTPGRTFSFLQVR